MSAVLDSATAVGQLVAARPSRSRVFERLGIDYCCGGKLTLAEACSRKGLAVDQVLATLSAAENGGTGAGAPQCDPAALTLGELCDHIESTHHVRLREELPRIQGLAQKVLQAHGANHPWLGRLAILFDALQAELLEHLAKEEQILFPAIRALEAGREPQTPCGGHLQGPIQVMEMEHDQAGAALAELRTISNDFTPPAEACNTFRALLDALAELEADTHQHIHKENNILFPRALERFGAGH